MRVSISIHNRHSPVGGGIPLGASTWDGIYLDVPLLGLADGATPGSVTPQVGSVSPVCTNAPPFDAFGIGGRSAVFADVTGSKYLRADGLATFFAGSDKPGTVIERLKRDWPLSQRAGWGAGNSAQSTNDFFYGAFAGGAGNSPLFVKDAIAEATKTLTGSAPLDYTDHVVAWVNDGTTGWVYVDGVLVATGDLDTLAITPNRFAIGARFTTAVVDVFGGWISHFAMTSRVLTQAEVVIVTNAWRANDLGMPGLASGTPFLPIGDSLYRGDSDTYATSSTRGGLRYRTYESWRKNRLRIRFVGHLTQGIFANPDCSCQGGADTTLLRTYVNTYIPIYQPRGLHFWGGTNDSDSIESGALTLAAWSANMAGALADARTRLDAIAANGGHAQIIVNNLTPLQPGWPGETAIPTMNAEFINIWNAHDAAYPTKPPLIREDFWTAIGGVYNASFYKDETHMNPAGYDLLAVEHLAKTSAYFQSIAA